MVLQLLRDPMPHHMCLWKAMQEQQRGSISTAPSTHKNLGIAGVDALGIKPVEPWC
jgi:hypothetical protein